MSRPHRPALGPAPFTSSALPVMLAAALWFPATAGAQSAAPVMDDGMGSHAAHAGHGGDANMRFHMRMTPTRLATRADSARARQVADELRRAIAKYRDTATAVADGYQMFLPRVKDQPVYHFTNYRHAFGAAFHFDPATPTSLLYRRQPDGSMKLVGAMYTAPKRTSPERLDQRVPLSIGRWHEHVNWCLPKKAERERWREQRDGHPVFGPASPIATKAACDAVGGEFHPSLFGWMIHANVFEGDELGQIFGEE